jgi:hypothetical protein
MSPTSSTWTLKGIIGEFQGNTLHLTPPMMTVGRTHQNHIVISDTNISRHHATIFIEVEHLYIQDEGSRNGVLINDKRISKGIKVTLKHNDRVFIGPHGFIVEIAEASMRSGISHAPIREMDTPPKAIENSQFQPTTHLKTPLLEKLRSLEILRKIPKIELNRRTIMYGAMTLVVVIVMISKIQKTSNSDEKKQSEAATVEILPHSTSQPEQVLLDDAEIDTLKAQAKSALQFQDFLAATELYEKIVLARPKDEYIKTQYEFSKKQLKRLIEKHLEYAKREYEKLNYERAIIEWKQVLALTSKANPEVYQQTEQKIKDTEREMQKRR